jgi:membrane protein implicated in regulation of membrane protease activity
MNWSQLYLVCFGIGALWSLVATLMGGMHSSHSVHGHGAHFGHGHVGHGHSHAGGSSSSGWASWIGVLLTPGAIAVFLAWFGGVGYILTRHSPFSHWLDLAIAILLGVVGAMLLGSFFKWLLSHEKPLDPADTEMIGMLGRVSCAIRPAGVGEMIFVRDGSRRAVPARSDDGREIPRDEEVVITRYEKGIAFVRTWAALTQPGAESARPENSARGDC